MNHENRPELSRVKLFFILGSKFGIYKFTVLVIFDFKSNDKNITTFYNFKEKWK